MKSTRIITTIAIAALSASSLLADATIDQKTKVQFSGALGGIVNTFGGKAAREGVESTVVVKGDRKLTRTGDTGELVDLGEEKVYNIDFGRQTYKVTTFAELRKKMEEMQKSTGEDDDDASDSKGKKEKGTEYEVDVDVKETGKKEKIAGHDTKQVIMTITVREKGKKLEQSGGTVMTTDMWLAPKVTAMKEIADFDARYYKQLYGGLFSGAEMQQMAALLATSPQFGKAMKTMKEKSKSLEGTAMRSILTVETVANPNARAEEESEADSSPAGIVGGLLGRAMKARQSKEEGAATTPGRNRVFDSTTEVLRADGSAASGSVEIPAGFKLKK